MSQPAKLRVALDLDGSLESLDNTMDDLADALVRLDGVELFRFRSYHSSAPGDTAIRFRRLWAPLWRRSLGPALDGRLPKVDVVHVAGFLTPPTRSVPLIISVDDLRPLRGESRAQQRIKQLRRSVAHGAVLVASSRAASHEVQEVLQLERSEIFVVPPAVPLVAPTQGGADLVVNVTGLRKPFFELAPELVHVANSVGSRLVAVTSAALAQRIRSSGLPIKVLSRREARSAIATARVVLHMSDGARFPSFAIAALSAGVPTIARATAINRELLSGAAALAASDEEIPELLRDIWANDARRAIMTAAGSARAGDFAPSTAANAYAHLYREVVRGWTT